MKKLFIILSLLFSITAVSATEVSLESKITGLYVAFFNRAADQQGLDYWTERGESAQSQGKDISDVLKELSAGFATHPTFISAYAHLSNKEFVEEIYRNALGRDGDSGGITYWTNLLDNGMSRSDMVAIFVEVSLTSDLTPENYPNTSAEDLAAAQLRKDLISNKVTVALAFTKQLDILSNVIDSQNPENDPAYLASIKIISEVNEQTATVSGVLAFLDSIINSDDQIADILKANYLSPDIIKPVITLKGESTITLNVGDLYTEAGAAASDDRDGLIVVTLAGSVNTSTAGTYTLTYTATDSAGNSATKIRTVNVNAQECIQVITHAYNPATGEERDFPTPCDVLEGWIVGNAPDNKLSYDLEDGNHALMGPLKNATVNIYSLNDLENSIEAVQTDEYGGYTVLLDGIPDSELLLVSVSGGIDIDANDDGMLDDTLTQNNGIIHTYARAGELKGNNVNVTLLSEIIYQYTQHLIGKAHPDDIENAINNVASKLFADNTTKDINSFIPMKIDLRKKLNFEYLDLVNGDDSLASLYHNDFNLSKIEEKLNSLFAGKALSLHDMRLLENARYSQVTLDQPIETSIVSIGTDIFIDHDGNQSKLTDFVLKGTEVNFTVSLNDKMKILGWEGCDKVTNDLLTCTLTASDNDNRVTPYIVYKETIYADNVKDLTSYFVRNDSSDYNVTLDVNASNESKNFVDTIIVDDIIISVNSNNPFFRKVVNVIKIDENHYTFETEETSFLDIYKQGSIFTNKNLTHEDLIPSTSSQSRSLLYQSCNGMRLLPPKHKNDDEFIIVFGDYKLNRSLGDTSHGIDLTVTDGVTVKGSISFKLTPEFNMNMEWFTLKSLRFAVAKEIKTDLVITYSKDWTEKLDPKEFLKKRLATWNYWIPDTPIVLNIQLDFSLLVDYKIESSISIGGEYTKNRKVGFNYVNGDITIINTESSKGKFIGEMKPLQLSAGQYIMLSPMVTINKIAGIEVETKTGFYEEVSPVSFSLSNLDADTNLFAGKVDARFSAELKWAWSDWLAKYDWARNLGDKINRKIKNKTGGLQYIYSYNLFEWSNQVFERPAYLELISPANTDEIKYSDKSIDKHYIYTIKNTGEKKLEWNLEVIGGLKDNLSISPMYGELNEGEEVTVDVYFKNNNLSTLIGKNRAYLKFVNLSNTQSSNAATGTKTEKISLEVLEKLALPSSLNVSMTEENTMNINFDWVTSETDGVQGYNIYKTDFNYENNSCYNSYINIISSANENHYETTFNTFKNHQREEFRMVPGKKYCFKISAYKMTFGMLTGLRFNESELSEETIFEIPVNDPIEDTISPVITLNGLSSITLTVGDSYIDAGATASDNMDESVTVQSSGTVDANTAGTYTITYSAADSAGNNAIPVIRTVHVFAMEDSERTALDFMKTHPNEKLASTDCTAYIGGGETVSLEWVTTLDGEHILMTAITKGINSWRDVASALISYLAPSSNMMKSIDACSGVQTAVMYDLMTYDEAVAVQMNNSDPFADISDTANPSNGNNGQNTSVLTLAICESEYGEFSNAEWAETQAFIDTKSQAAACYQALVGAPIAGVDPQLYIDAYNAGIYQ